MRDGSEVFWRKNILAPAGSRYWQPIFVDSPAYSFGRGSEYSPSDSVLPELLMERRRVVEKRIHCMSAPSPVLETPNN